jgi:predicted transcriptional regulator
MEVHPKPDVAARLTRIAADRGSDAALLASEANENFVASDEWFVREVETGITAADRGDLLSHEEVGLAFSALSPRGSLGCAPRCTSEAARDLERIAYYLFDHAPERAEDFVNRI